MIEACSQQVGGWIRNGKYQFVWIRFPWKSILPKQRHARFEQMSNSWLRLAGSCSILAAACKQVGKYSWNPDESYVVDKFMLEHHLCHLGIRLVGTQPSSVVYRMLTSLAVVQHESLLMSRGRPFEVPHGGTTKEVPSH